MDNKYKGNIKAGAKALLPGLTLGNWLENYKQDAPIRLDGNGRLSPCQPIAAAKMNGAAGAKHALPL